MQDGVAMAEGAALNVLAGEAHRDALEQQRPDRKHFAGAPVDADAGLYRLLSGGEQAGELGVNREVLRRPRLRISDPAQHVAIHRGARAPVLTGAPETFPHAAKAWNLRSRPNFLGQLARMVQA